MRVERQTLSCSFRVGGDRRLRERLTQGNQRYFERFGYIFIVCASGKSASNMLELLESRLENSAEEELPVAAEQQRQITRLRLQKWVETQVCRSHP